MMNQGQQFADTDLSIELNELTRQANRANATFYTIDPRGLMAGQDLDEQVDPSRVGNASSEAAGQPARAGRADRRHRRRQHERLRQGAQAASTPRRATTTCSGITRPTRIPRSAGGRSKSGSKRRIRTAGISI